MRKTLAVATVAAALVGGAAHAAEIPDPPGHDWDHHGLFGTFDRGALQRGFQVFREVCYSCHSLDHVAYRTLEAIGYSSAEVEAIAAEYEVEYIDEETGDRDFRPAVPADRFVPPFPNRFAAAAANNNAVPPDLSVITKARLGGEDYIRGLLIGYQDEPPEGFELTDGLYYNDYFPGHQIGMAPPLFEDGVEYADGTPATVEQQAEDVVAFLAWAAQPELEERKSLGVKVLLFVVFLTGMLYALKLKIWSDVH